MTRSDLVKKIATENNIKQQEVSTVIDAFCQTIVNCYHNNERVDIKQFGAFIPKIRKARKAQNIRTKQTIDVPERKVLTFKPSSKVNE